jgi:hypothetical protein
MIRYKVFHAHCDDRHTHDDNVKTFITELCESGHTFINTNTVVYGSHQGLMNRFRTEITYKENPTRKVLVEKTQ